LRLLLNDQYRRRHTPDPPRARFVRWVNTRRRNWFPQRFNGNLAPAARRWRTPRFQQVESKGDLIFMSDSQFGGTHLDPGGPAFLFSARPRRTSRSRPRRSPRRPRPTRTAPVASCSRPILISAEFNFRRPLNVDPPARLLTLKGINVTIVEEDKRPHASVQRRAVQPATPDENLSNGEVNGLKIEGGQYTPDRGVDRR